MEQTTVLLVIQISLTLVLTLFILIIMLRQPLSPSLKLRFNNGKKTITFKHRQKATVSFYIENVGTIFAKPAAIDLTGWLNFPAGFTPTLITSFGKPNSNVGLSGVFKDKQMKVLGFPLERNLFHKERWDFDVKVRMPTKKGTYQIPIPLKQARGNCDTKVLKIKVI